MFPLSITAETAERVSTCLPPAEDRVLTQVRQCAGNEMLYNLHTSFLLKIYNILSPEKLLIKTKTASLALRYTTATKLGSHQMKGKIRNKLIKSCTQVSVLQIVTRKCTMERLEFWRVSSRLFYLGLVFAFWNSHVLPHSESELTSCENK